MRKRWTLVEVLPGERPHEWVAKFAAHDDEVRCVSFLAVREPEISLMIRYHKALLETATEQGKS